MRRVVVVVLLTGLASFASAAEEKPAKSRITSIGLFKNGWPSCKERSRWRGPAPTASKTCPSRSTARSGWKAMRRSPRGSAAAWSKCPPGRPAGPISRRSLRAARSWSTSASRAFLLPPARSWRSTRLKGKRPGAAPISSPATIITPAMAATRVSPRAGCWC